MVKPGNVAPAPAVSSNSAASWLQRPLFALVIILLAGFAVYANSFSAPFVLDDTQSIVENATLRNWRDWPAVFSPPLDAGVGGRPLLNFSYAINYAISGLDPWSYHALSLLIHLAGGLALFGVVRQTLLNSPSLPERTRALALSFAFSVALLWTVHPLQTNAVTYLSQRAESLMGLFWLLTMYTFVRGAVPSARSNFWLTLSALSCLAGMATKEVMITAPVLVLLFDRAFFAGSFGHALYQRRHYYLGLAATWILVGVLLLDVRHRNVGFNLGVSAWTYALTECKVLVLYLKLAVWPHPLVFDYGREFLHRIDEAAPYALLLIPVLVAGGFALVRYPKFGFIAAWFFFILSPTSSFLPVSMQPMAESRLYLPLISVWVVLLSAAARFAPRFFLPAVGAVAAIFGGLTFQRNLTFGSTESIWRDTLVKRPNSSRAHNNYADVLLALGRPAEALLHYEASLRLGPTRYETYDDDNNGGQALLQLGRVQEAVVEFERALQIYPDAYQAHNNLGTALLTLGHPAQALAHYEHAALAAPTDAGIQLNLGLALVQLDRAVEALPHFQEAIRLNPNYAIAHYALGNALLQLDRPHDAIPAYEAALKIDPSEAAAEGNLGTALFQSGQIDDAIRHYEAALRLKPDYAMAHDNLGNAFVQQGRVDDALTHYAQAARLAPDDPDVHNDFGKALVTKNRIQEAAHEFRTALRLNPAFDEARENLARLPAP